MFPNHQTREGCCHYGNVDIRGEEWESQEGWYFEWHWDPRAWVLFRFIRSKRLRGEFTIGIGPFWFERMRFGRIPRSEHYDNWL